MKKSFDYQVVDKTNDGADIQLMDWVNGADYSEDQVIPRQLNGRCYKLIPSKEFIKAIEKEKKRLADEIREIESRQPDADNPEQRLENFNQIYQEAKEYKQSLNKQVKVLGLGDDFASFINLQHNL